MNALPPPVATTSRDLIRQRLVEFAAVCLVLSWMPWAALAVLGVSIEQGARSLAFGIAAAGPSLAVLVMWLWRHERRPEPAVRWSVGWPLSAIALGAAAPLAVAAMTHIDELSAIPRHASAAITEIGIVAAIAFTFLAGPVAEEFGWRGYVQPRLRQRLGRSVTTLLLGAVWGLWHLPLFLMPGTSQHESGLFTQQGLLFFLELVPLSYLMLFVTEHLRGGVPAAILLHAVWNLADELVPPPSLRDQWLVLLLLVALALTMALLWRRDDQTAHIKSEK